MKTETGSFVPGTIARLVVTEESVSKIAKASEYPH